MGTFFPYHYITYGNGTAFGQVCENGSIMKSMAMRSTSSLKIKGTFFPYHYITYGKERALVRDRALGKRYRENDSIMKSMAIVDFFIENKGTFFPYHYITYGSRDSFGPYICKNGSIMKSMAMIRASSLKIKRNFLPPYHYITYGNRTGFGRIICENGSIMKSMAMVDFFIENKGTFFPYHYITYGKQNTALQFIICENRLDNEIHGYGRLLH
ncbi:hypothetical protein H6P81_021638 [Aristolochia fimbriata]|uniref:Uncharacterized protein n=1 Tax=Aristolochia fimbriata TaxID=158543 RepID=A0AAV7DS93_ARIFI|nr:hypothetical protein H6P81_021638 [Aristolochia fimbriata]